MDDTTTDLFLGGRLRLRQPLHGFRAGQDSVFLAAAVPARPHQSTLELGCGTGAAILALGVRVGDLALAGLELQPAYAALARANAALNGLALEVLEGDVEVPPAALRARPFDHVLLNPPFFDRAASTRARDPGRDIAHGGGAPLSAWLALAARRLAPGGTMTLIQRTARLRTLVEALPPSIGSPEILPLAPRAHEAPATILLRARKGGRADLRLLAPLAVHEGPGFAPWAQACLRDGAPLPWN